MKANEIKAIALEVIKDCHTCKEVSNKYNELVERYGKDNAVAIRSKAKDLVKVRMAYYTDNANKVINATKDGNRIARLIWSDILKDKSINKFAILVYNHCDKDVENIINRYASYKTANGLCACKHTNKQGEIYFTAFELATSKVPTALSVLREAIRNAKTACIKGVYNYRVVDVQ